MAAVAALLIPALLCAADQVVTGTFSGTKSYTSLEGIVFDHAVLSSGARVTTTANYAVRLGPGTRLADGARLSITIPDNDGLSNRCEMTYFGDLTHLPTVDDDNDGLTNFQECSLGYNPNQHNPDNDADGLPDAWEVKYFGLDLSNGRDDDADGDGISNGIEYKLGSDPSTDTGQRPGLIYEYDDLGRITSIRQIPAR